MTQLPPLLLLIRNLYLTPKSYTILLLSQLTQIPESAFLKSPLCSLLWSNFVNIWQVGGGTTEKHYCWLHCFQCMLNYSVCYTILYCADKSLHHQYFSFSKYFTLCGFWMTHMYLNPLNGLQDVVGWIQSLGQEKKSF